MPKVRSFKDATGDTWYEMSDFPNRYTLHKPLARPGGSDGGGGWHGTETNISSRWAPLHSYKLREIGPKPKGIKVTLTQSEIDLLDELLYGYVGSGLSDEAGGDKFQALASVDPQDSRIVRNLAGIPTLKAS